MVSYRLIAVAGFAATVYSIPLNINLGAYSPALVVGDGEISFGGGQDVSNLMNALEGAAANAAGGAAAGGRTNGAATPAAQAPAAVAAAEVPVAAAATTAPAAAAASVSDSGLVASPAPAATTADANVQVQEQATPVLPLQGMGKEIAPREDEAPKAKRDLAGFDRALQYAENALTKGPVIQLGTGEGGAGVGVIVDNRPAAAAGGARGRTKRDEQPRRRTKVTTMYVRRGIPADLQTSTEVETRAIKSVPAVAAPAVKSKREDATNSVLDAINLNVNDPQGITMTFVETLDDNEE